MNLRNLASIRILFLILAIIYLIDCKNKKEANQWDNVKTDRNLSKDSVYHKLDEQEEIFGFDIGDSSMKRTSDVAYVRGEIKLTDENSRLNNCRANFDQSGTLIINIGIGDGFSSWGFTISYKNKKFYTEPYYYTDMIIPGEIKPSYKIIYQKLTLDKADYKVGDSIYGRIEFKSAETDKDSKKTNHTGIGNFRTKVGKLVLHPEN